VILELGLSLGAKMFALLALKVQLQMIALAFGLAEPGIGLALVNITSLPIAFIYHFSDAEVVT